VTVIQQDLLQAMCYSFDCIKTRAAPSPTCLDRQGGTREGMRPLRQRKVARSPPRIKPMEGFFMSKEPKPPTQPKGRVIYKGSVPDTDPRYASGWNYLSGKNLAPKPPEREPVSAAPDTAPVAPNVGED
jgi:hypothetical protein